MEHAASFFLAMVFMTCICLNIMGFPLVKSVLRVFQFGIPPVKEFGTIFALWYNARFSELAKAARGIDLTSCT